MSFIIIFLQLQLSRKMDKIRIRNIYIGLVKVYCNLVGCTIIIHCILPDCNFIIGKIQLTHNGFIQQNFLCHRK